METDWDGFRSKESEVDSTFDSIQFRDLKLFLAPNEPCEFLNNELEMKWIESKIRIQLILEFI